MTPNEKNKIDQLLQEFHDFQITQLQINGHTHEEMKTVQSSLDSIARGIYGDELNKFKGVLDRQIDAEERGADRDLKIGKIEKVQYRMGVWGGGLVIGLQAAWIFLKDKFF